MTPILNPRSDDPSGLADELDARGVVCLNGAVASEWLADARSEIEDLLRTRGEQFHFIRNPVGEEHRSIEALQGDIELLGLLKGIVRSRLSENSACSDATSVSLRVVAGPCGDDDAHSFHYDAEALTMAVPLFVPDAERGRRGELIGFFNKRPFGRTLAVNVLDKLIRQSGMYRKVIIRRRGRATMTMVDMAVGNAYLFWGYRSLHANVPCAPGQRRVTLLVKFGDPHMSNPMLLTAARLRRSTRSWFGRHPEQSTSQSSAPRRELESVD